MFKRRRDTGRFGNEPMTIKRNQKRVTRLDVLHFNRPKERDIGRETGRERERQEGRDILCFV